jgi:hypothetical protein
MLNSMKRRPQDFKRRILERHNSIAYIDLLQREELWLQLIPDNQLGKRYYNLKRTARHWAASEKDKLTIAEKISTAKKGIPLPYQTECARVVNLGKKRSDETKEKIRQKAIGRKLAPEHAEKCRKAHLGKKMSDDAKQRIGNFFRNRPLSEDHKAKLRKPQEKINCPYCWKIGGKSVMKKWHFENCKFKN